MRDPLGQHAASFKHRLGQIFPIFLHLNVLFSSENLMNEEFFQKPIVLLHGYEPGMRIIGRPYKVRRFNLSDKSRNYSDGLNARVSFVMQR